MKSYDMKSYEIPGEKINYSISGPAADGTFELTPSDATTTSSSSSSSSTKQIILYIQTGRYPTPTENQLIIQGPSLPLVGYIHATRDETDKRQGVQFPRWRYTGSAIRSPFDIDVKLSAHSDSLFPKIRIRNLENSVSSASENKSENKFSK